MRGGQVGTKGTLGGILGGLSSSLLLTDQSSETGFGRGGGLGGMGTRGGISGLSAGPELEYRSLDDWKCSGCLRQEESLTNCALSALWKCDPWAPYLAPPSIQLLAPKPSPALVPLSSVPGQEKAIELLPPPTRPEGLSW